VKGRLLLDIVVQSSTILELFTHKDKTLLIRRNALLVLNFGLYIVDCVRRLDLQGDHLAGKGLDENLHTATETKDEVKGRLLLDIVVRESLTVLELFADESKALLIRWDAVNN
jgi:hypothetical protein